MRDQARSGARAAIERALAAGDWPWPEALRTSRAFVDGIVSLAVTCRRCNLSEAALAAEVADELPTRSALARLMLAAARVDAGGVQRPRESDDTSSQRAFRSAAAVWVAALAADEALGAASVAAALAALGGRDDAFGKRIDAEEIADVWSWPAPEEAVPLVAPPMAFSASRLNGYVKCSRRWFYEYLCDAVEDQGSAAATYGKVFHEALESFHRIVRFPAEWSGNALLERLHAELDLAFERNRDAFASRLEFEVSRLKARAVAAHYARWLRAEADDQPMRVEAVESLQRWSMGGHEFVGFVDRIDRPVAGGPITIYDYKTGRIPEDPQEYIEQIRRGDEAQLALYYAVRRLRGDRVGRLALVSLRDPRDAVWVLALDMLGEDGKLEAERAPRSGVLNGTCSPSDIEASLAVLTARADLLTKHGVAHFQVGVDPPCMHCEYARACRERPFETERVFAR